MEQRLRDAARAAIGFMPDNEGIALYEAALTVASDDPLLEVGSYCGRSTIYLGAAAKAGQSVLYAVDHHRGSEEHQQGEEYHDERFVDPETGRFDTFPTFRRTIEDAGLLDWVVPVVARSDVVRNMWQTPLSFVLIDGSHSPEAARKDFLWSSAVRLGGLLAIHDVFPDPKDGGRPPFEIYERALGTQEFEQVVEEGSLRVLKRIREPGYRFWEGLAPEET